MKIQEGVLLSRYTSFRIGGPARFFAEPTSIEEIKEAVAFAHERGLSRLVLGEGSNALISDEGFSGLAIRPLIKGIELQDDGVFVVGAGEHWDDLVAFSVRENFSGIENLSWIPGSVGAAPVQNIGAYGAELGDVLLWVEAFNPTTGEIQKFTKEECRFGYRDSLFKTEAGKKFIIVRIALKLAKNGVPNITYKDLAKYFADKTVPSIAEVRAAVIDIRERKLPDIRKVGTAGSFFKNPIIFGEKYAELSAQFPDLPSFAATGGQKKIPLAWILDKICGLNGFREGNIGLYETQPLAIVNFGGATFKEVKHFAEKISEIVKEKTGIDIEWEVNEISEK